jgi:Tfp pilus assembly protein PilX
MRAMANRSCTRGATLPATLLLVAAATLTALAALRSAASETRLSGTLLAANTAFALAELGIAAGMQTALTEPARLPDSSPLTLPPQTIAGMGSVNVLIQPTASDNACPALAPLPAVRRHFEIHATSVADHSVQTTHTQGFYVCRELCVTAGCVALELLPVRSYWHERAGAVQ